MITNDDLKPMPADFDPCITRGSLKGDDALVWIGGSGSPLERILFATFLPAGISDDSVSAAKDQLRRTIWQAEQMAHLRSLDPDEHPLRRSE